MFDLRTRDVCFISPEQVKLGDELNEIVDVAMTLRFSENEVRATDEWPENLPGRDVEVDLRTQGEPADRGARQEGGRKGIQVDLRLSGSRQLSSFEL